MRSQARVWLMAVVCGALLAAFLPAAAQAAFGIEKFAAVNCKEEFPECAAKKSADYAKFYPVEPTATEAEHEGFTQAGGRVPFGITTFKVNTEGPPGQEYPAGTVSGGEIVNPAGIVAHIRTDVAPGLATNPFAPTMCSVASFEGHEVKVEGKVFHTAPECTSASEIGINHAVVFIPAAVAKVAGGADVPLEGKVYDLTPGEGKWASKFGVALNLEPLLGAPLYAHTIINGNVEWGKQAAGTGQSDFHDYFEIEVNPELPLVASRLSFFGNIGKNGAAKKGEGDFITNATNCTDSEDLKTRLALTDLAGVTETKTFTEPIGLEGCPLAFAPGFSFISGSNGSEQPNQFTATASEEHVPNATDVSQVRTASFTLPEGMTLNPSAAKELTACTEAQAHLENAAPSREGSSIWGSAFGVGCAASSKIGTVTLEVPTLPAGSLKGDVYLAAPNSGTITEPPYKVIVVANNAEYNVSVRLLGETIPDPVTGQVTTYFNHNPQQPFTSLALKFERGVLAPIANPLVCGTPEGSANFEGNSNPGKVTTDKFGVSIAGCASPLPFKLAQTTANSNNNAGASTAFTFNLARNDGEQYVDTVKTTLPPGLVGEIPKAERCAAAAAESETTACPAGSQIGTATVLAGSGGSPFSFTGPVYLTNSIQGAPYGLSIKVPAVAGPFNLGTIVTIAKIKANPLTAQVEVESTLPRIRRGIPDRIKSITVAVNKSGFMINPTNCGKLATVSSVSGYTLLAGGITAHGTFESPFQVSNCNALKFKPKFTASSNARTSRVSGAALTTTLTMPSGQSNIKSVKVQLPRNLPSRLTTLQKACVAATFEANPYFCARTAWVGEAIVKTPTLPTVLKGPAILVSHAGAAFPDLDLVLEDQNHLRVILVGNTNIKNGITTTTFASTPDVPASSVTVKLPRQTNSALGAFGGLCAKPLVMPTTITSQTGKTVKLNPIINVAGCGVQVIGHKVVGGTLFLTVRAPEAGRISAGGNGLTKVFRRASRARQVLSLKVRLSAAGRRRGKPFKVNVRIGFVPKKGHNKVSFTKVTFR
jgi:hypothetical protein